MIASTVSTVEQMCVYSDCSFNCFAFLQYVDLNSSRNLLICGVSVFTGLVLPSWFHSNPDTISTGKSDVARVCIFRVQQVLYKAYSVTKYRKFGVYYRVRVQNHGYLEYKIMDITFHTERQFRVLKITKSKKNMN